MINLWKEEDLNLSSEVVESMNNVLNIFYENYGWSRKATDDEIYATKSYCNI